MEYTKKMAKKPLNPRKNYDFGSMGVLEYFEFPASEMAKVKSAAYTYGFRNGKKFSVHKEDDLAFCQRIA